MKTILGLDLSITSTGYAVLGPDKTIVTGTITSTPNPNRGERLWKLLDALDEIVKKHKPHLVLIEGYSYGSHNHQLAYMAEWGGVVRFHLQRIGIDIIEVSPGNLKKFVTGKGNAKKEQMLLASYKKWGIEFATNDECDAFALAKYGQSLG